MRRPEPAPRLRRSPRTPGNEPRPLFPRGLYQYGDTPDVAALVAPRALHLNFGENDGDSPIREVREGVATIARAYEKSGATGNFSHYIEQGAGHVLSDEMWRRTRAWFDRHLR